jgi:hypothetical protein
MAQQNPTQQFTLPVPAGVTSITLLGNGTQLDVQWGGMGAHYAQGGQGTGGAGATKASLQTQTPARRTPSRRKSGSRSRSRANKGSRSAGNAPAAE